MNNNDVSNPNKHPVLPLPVWMFVTPDMAKGLISTDNRPIRRRTVADYRRKMESGLWSFSPHGITIAPDGTSSDGNHRMHALSEARIPGVWLLVADWRVNSKDLRVDIGTKRKLSDFSTLPPMVVETIVGIARVRFSEDHGNEGMDPTEMERATELYGDVAFKLYEACASSAKCRSSQSIRAGFAAAILSGEDEKTLCDQYREFVLNTCSRKPAIVSLSRQVETLKMDRVEMLARAYVAAKGLDNTRNLVRCVDNVMDEVKKVLANHIATHKTR